MFVNSFFVFSNKGLLFPVFYGTMYTDEKRRDFMSQGKITDKQREILEYIKEMILKKGYPCARFVKRYT